MTGGFHRILTKRLSAGRAIIAASCLVAAGAHAEAWFDAGDSALRSDLQFLVDAGVIDVVVTSWPIPTADIAWALEKITDKEHLSAGQLAALGRMRQRLGVFRRDSVRATGHVYGAENPIQLRTFEDTPRDEFEIGGTLSAAGSRFSGRLAVAWVSDPDDEQEWRLDDTYGSMRLGNWLLTAGALDRWWGPGWDASLILSNNARPIPAVALDRESSAPFETPWLSWIGPWRLTTFMGLMEDDREDVDHPLLFGMRISFRPFGNLHIGSVHPLRGIEFALERTAQWCGEGLPCDFNALWNVLTGNDNAGETVDPEDEPGNQLAGWSLRWASPFASFPVAFYRQKIGETIDLNSPLPRRTLDLLGLETWWSTGSVNWRAHAEYADTACSEPAGQTEPAFDCAYNNSIFFVEGYRYRGRPIGDSIDGDGLSYTLGLQVELPSRLSGSMLLRYAELNRGGSVPDTRNTVATEPVDAWDIEIFARLPLLHSELELGLGYDSAKAQLTDEVEDTIHAFVAYQYRF